MGNREALLLGAKRCLLTKGYTRTTARDIAAAADVSLAAIGYHFSSKEALLTEALLLAIDDWGQEFSRALATIGPANADPTARFEATWARVIETFETHRPMWAANFEIFAQMDHLPDIRRVLGNSLQQVRLGLASFFLNKKESEIDEPTARIAGGFYHVLMSGLIAQWLIDPEHALSARDLTEALQIITAEMKSSRKSPQPKPRRTQKKSTRR
jgi:AcrR family transcriptional regulator